MSWVGALGGLLHVFASYGAQKITAQHSGVTAAHASEAARRARGSRVEGQTCWRARFASPVLRTCLIATTQMVDEGTSHRQAANMAAPVAGAEELLNQPAL